MLSKCDRRTKGEEALRKASRVVIEFFKKRDGDVTRLHVVKQREFIKSCRMVLENCSGNLSWKERPSYWPDDPLVLFKDPNNNKRNQHLKGTVRFFVNKEKDLLSAAEVYDSLVKLSNQRCNSSKQPHDWPVNSSDTEKQYNRTKDCLPSFQIVDHQKEKRRIVENWLRSENFYSDVRQLERLDDTLTRIKLHPSLSVDEKRLQAELCQQELQEFIDGCYSSALSLSSSVDDQHGSPFYAESSASKQPQESPTEMSQTTWHSIQESESGDAELDMEYNLREDPDTVISVSDCQCFSRSGENMVEDNNIEQTLFFGSQEQTEGEMPEVPQVTPGASCKVISGVQADQKSFSTLKPNAWLDDAAEDLKPAFCEIPEVKVSGEKLSKVKVPGVKLSEVPQVPPGASYKVIGGVPVYQTSFNSLKPNQWIDDAIISAVLALKENDDSAVDAFPILDFKNRRNYYDIAHHKLQRETSEWKRWLLIPAFYENHWVLLAADNEKKKFCILDSRPSEQLASELALWFKDLMFRYNGSRSGEWEKIKLPCGRQKDGNSCGYFLLMNAEAFVNDISPDLFRQCLVFPFREWIIEKLKFADTLGGIFQHRSLEVAQEESFCRICQEMHCEVVLKSKSDCTVMQF